MEKEQGEKMEKEQGEKNGKSTQWILFILPLGSAIIWGLNIVVVKYSITFVTASSISFYRSFIALLILSPFILPSLIRNMKAIYPYLWKIFILGLSGMFGYQFLSNIGAKTTTAINMGVINGMTPVFTVCISFFILKAKINFRIFIGAIISFIGLIIFLAQKNPLDLIKNGLNTGDYFMFAGVFCYAMYGILLKLWRIPISLLNMLYLQLFFTVLCHIPLFFFSDIGPITVHNYWVFLYTSIFSSIIAFFAWIKSIDLLGIEKTVIFSNLIPVFAVLISVMVLNEHWSINNTIGLFIVIMGLFLTNKTYSSKVKKVSP